MTRALLLLPVLAAALHADTAVQTDWSGGPGVWGPVIEFGIDFYYDTMTAYYCTPSGDLSLRMVDDVIGHEVDDDFGSAASVWSADIDGDGDMDIVGAAFGDHDVSWWENLDGTGTSWAEHPIDSSFSYAESVCSEDIDDDGDMDVVAASADNSGGTYWWENLDGSGMSWTERAIDEEFPYAVWVCCTDINGDGDIDVLGASIDADEIPWWENLDGSGTSWAKHVVTSDFPYAECVHSDDIDGDGDMDVIGCGGSGKVAWWENATGTGTLWALHLVGSYSSVLDCVYSDDIDGDGDTDLIVAADDMGILDDVCWWENLDGSGSQWTKHIVDGDFWGASSVCTEDIDSDGDRDIVGACFYQADRDITWWENLSGSGTSWRSHLVDPTLPGANSVYCADVNGDGHVDVVGAGRSWDLVRWWELVSYASSGHLVSSVLDVECGPDWDTIDWSVDVPAGTSAAFQVRSSSDPDSSSMGPWSDTLYTPCSLEGILTDWEQYVQYRALLETSDPDITPTLHDVTISWDPVGVSGDPEPASFDLLQFTPNPTANPPIASFILPAELSVRILVFDVSGRLMWSTDLEGLQAGCHVVPLGELSTGIYFCQLRTTCVTDVERFVVVE